MPPKKRSAAPSEEEERGFFGTIWDWIKALFMFIIQCIVWIFTGIYELLRAIFACFEFIWYPIKERVAACCNWCGNKNHRSRDPHFSTYDNEL